VPSSELQPLAGGLAGEVVDPAALGARAAEVAALADGHRHTSPSHPYGTPLRRAAPKLLLRAMGVPVGVPLSGAVEAPHDPLLCGMEPHCRSPGRPGAFPNSPVPCAERGEGG
jgi:hypothetical protein